MNLMIRTTMVFFGTLIAAALLVLAGPRAISAFSLDSPARLFTSASPGGAHVASAPRPGR
jgi:hypothetical protein